MAPIGVLTTGIVCCCAYVLALEKIWVVQLYRLHKNFIIFNQTLGELQRLYNVTSKKTGQNHEKDVNQM